MLAQPNSETPQSLSARRIFKFADLFGADLMDYAAQLLNARAKPNQFILANPVVL